MDQIFKMVDIKNKLNLTNIGVPKWGGFPNGVLQHLNFLTF